MRLVAVAIVAMASTAAAAPLAPPLCVPASGVEPSLFVVRGVPVVCWAETGDCVQLGASEAERLAVGHPAKPSEAEPQLRQADKKAILCAGAVCKPVGKKLQAAMTPPGKHVELTEDVAIAVVVDSDKAATTVWDLAKDRPIKLRAPRELAPRKVKLVKATAIGTTVIATWTDCAGPCARAAVIDRQGAARGPVFPAGTALALDDQRIAVVPTTAAGKVTILDVKTGKAATTVALANGPVEAAGTRFSAEQVGVVWREGQGSGPFKFARILAPAGKPATLGEAQLIPACTR